MQCLLSDPFLICCHLTEGRFSCHRLPAEPRTVVLHRARKGFGFILRGAKAMSPLMELQPSERCPALQYLDDVDQGGVADMAGLRKGDYLLAVSSIFEEASR
jgi:SH3/ankyrin repeat-containing protein